MSKVFKISISAGAKEHLDQWLAKANEGFDAGIVDGPLVVSELILGLDESRIEEFQKKSFDVKKLLKNMLERSEDELDVSHLIERLNEAKNAEITSHGLKPRVRKRKPRKVSSGSSAAQSGCSDE